MDPCETPQAGVISSMEIIDDQDFLSFGSNTGKQKARVNILAGGEDRSRVEGFISRRGSEFALRHLCEKFGASLFDKLPKLWDCLTEVLVPASSLDEEKITLAIESVKDPQILINNIQVIAFLTLLFIPSILILVLFQSTLASMFLIWLDNPAVVENVICSYFIYSCRWILGEIVKN